MADFFTQLLGRTSERTMTPRPVIAPLFAPGPLLAGNIPADIALEEEVSGKNIVPPVERLHGATGERIVPLARTTLQSEKEVPQVRETGGDTWRGRFTPETRPSLIEQQSTPGQMPGRTSILPRFALEPSFQPSEWRQQSLPQGPLPASPQQIGRNRHSGGEPSLNSARITPTGSRNRHSGGEPSAPEAPVVKVSIGRIDVRAVMPPPPAPPRKAASPAPRPSLNEYLEARNREKR